MAHDIDTIIMTIDGVEAKSRKLKKFLNGIHDHKNWIVEESGYLEYLDGCNDIENKLKNLNILERMYFKDWLSENFTVDEYLKQRKEWQEYDIWTIIDILLNISCDYQRINAMLDTIHDHSKWDIAESVYLPKCKELSAKGRVASPEVMEELEELTK
jgi:hypothetical protein